MAGDCAEEIRISGGQQWGVQMSDVIEVRIGWADILRYHTTPELWDYLRSCGVDPRTMSCRRDDARREWVYVGERVRPPLHRVWPNLRGKADITDLPVDSQDIVDHVERMRIGR